MSEFSRVAPDVVLGRDVKIYGFVNLYGCRVGDETRIGTFVEIQKGASVGARYAPPPPARVCRPYSFGDTRPRIGATGSETQNTP